MEIAGYFASVLIGVTLGLIGGGGSILTVPVLVYLFGVNAVLATTYSLFIVGTTSIVGAISYFKKGLVNTKAVVFFGAPSIAAVLVTRAFILPSIPNTVFSIDVFKVTKGILLMVLFAVLMIFASYRMIKKNKFSSNDSHTKPSFDYRLIFIQGIFIGFITGLIGAGGGFLIIPALVNLVKLPMKTAVGTSLVIIAVNSLIGFSSSLFNMSIEWTFLFTIAAIAVIGIIVGSYASTKINGATLKPAFGWFVLVMGIYIIVKEIVLK